MKLDYDSVQGTRKGVIALLQPKVNVSSRGMIPTSQQVFAIRLPCSGLDSAEIKLALKLNVSAPVDSGYRDISLVFKRNKICLLGVRTPPKHEDSVRLEAGPMTNGNSVLYIAATCACALILVVVSFASCLYIRSSKARSQHPRKTINYYSAPMANGMATSSILVKVDNRPGSVNSGSYATIADLEPLYARPCGSQASYYAASHVTHLSQSTDPCDKARAMTVPRSALHCRNVVHEGTFGRVYRGTLSNAGRDQEVIIKTVTDAASAYQSSLLVVEGSQLAGLVHGNVATLAAACLENISSPMLAYVCSPNDMNLKTYLTDGKHHPLTRDLVNIAVQIARAGAFLHGRGLLHRDIATRNCLLDTSTQRARLTDAALSRDLFPQDYHCLGDNENRPISWMALETLQHGQHTTASDAWSFGVFLWELATMGQQPYVEVDPFELTVFLRDGYRLSQPRPCPDELFAVMAVCWLASSRERPTMPQLLAYLQEFYDALGGFI